MEVMTLIRNNTIRSRGYVFSEGEMRSYRIKGIYNSMTDADYMDLEYMERFIRRCFNPALGECAISESAINTSGRNPVRILSVIVFCDMESLELFVLANKSLYLGADPTMNGRMN